MTFIDLCRIMRPKRASPQLFPIEREYLDIAWIAPFVAAENGDELPRVTVYFGVNFDPEGAAADGAKLAESIDDERIDFGDAADSVHIGIGTEKAAAIILTLAAGDD